MSLTYRKIEFEKDWFISPYFRLIDRINLEHIYLFFDKGNNSTHFDKSEQYERTLNFPGKESKNKASLKLDVTLIYDWEEFESLKQEYNQFINGNISTATLPYQFDWMACVKGLYTPELTPYFLVVRESNTIIGFAPLMKETKPLSKGGITRLCVWGESLQSSLNNFLPDFVCFNGKEDIVIASIKNYLFGAGKKDWDVLEFKNYSELNASLPCIEKYFPFNRQADENMDGYVITFPENKSEGNKELFSHISSRRLKDLRRVERRFKEAHPDVEFKRYTSIDKALFSQLATIHTKRQKSLADKGHDRLFLFEDPVQRSVMWDLIKLAEKNEWLDIYTVETEGEIASFVINIIQPETSVSLLTAFDEKYSKFSPSFLLEKFALESEFDRGETKEVNSLPGRTDVKERFSNQKFRTLKITILNHQNLSSIFKIGLWFSLRLLNVLKSKTFQ